MACDLEVDVNGEETFFVNKEILCSHCGRLSKLFSKPSSSVMETADTLKVVLHEVPGGAEAFELIARFCYGNGGVQLNPSNTCLLHCAAHFMEMAGGRATSKPDLIKETEKSLEGVSHWMWTEIIHCLKQCQDFFLIASTSGVLDKLLDSMVARIATPTDNSPTDSSPESSGFRFSFDTRSTLSGKIGSHHRTWWFEDAAGLNLQIVERAVRTMISRKLDNVCISRFLFYYHKISFANAIPEDKKKATETVIDLLFSLDRSSVPSKSLFGILRVCSSSLNLSKWSRNRLESMIGARMDHVVLDNLLVPAPTGMGSLYDVDLVLRFLKFFLDSGGRKVIDRLKKVGSLMDMYLTEVAPDSGLRPFKFVTLATALPDAARDSHDALYRAIDMYLEVHPRLSEEEKTKICCAINYERLSSESCKHLAQNSKFPSRTALQALVSQHSKLKNLLKDTNIMGPVPLAKGKDSNEQIILYAKKLDLSMENEKLRANLQGMQWKVMELEKVCRKMQIQMARMTESAKISSSSHRSSTRSLPKLCS